MHTSGEEIGADEIAAISLSEVVEDSIAVQANWIILFRITIQLVIILIFCSLSNLEVLSEELVSLVEHEHLALGDLGDALLDQVEHSAGRADHQLHHSVQTHDVVAQLDVLGELDADLRSLEGELASGHDDKRLDVLDTRVYHLEHGNRVGTRLACAVLCARDNVLA
ncbi:hypothetical protein WR25_23893 [Diploscapter pachys]|uniref:Uncharacterized protein n=1 Tax=Diploscapter pachys TaxID=2018661 RepID=A0A2A2L171_9BILA|nr:hypothetical protein WR25_23893 [Diploscapter pachys]